MSHCTDHPFLCPFVTDSKVQRTILELLNWLDRFDPTQNIKVVMATNYVDILDLALLRPGHTGGKIEFLLLNEKVVSEVN